MDGCEPESCRRESVSDREGEEGLWDPAESLLPSGESLCPGKGTPGLGVRVCCASTELFNRDICPVGFWGGADLLSWSPSMTPRVPTCTKDRE